MKKIFAMLATILFCGSMLVSCNKDDDDAGEMVTLGGETTLRK